MGNYVAGSHHIRIVQFTYGKDQLGLRERDIDYKDKQNFDADLHIICRASQLLDNIADAVGTNCYIEVMQCVVDCYLDKSIDPLICMWYAVFFLHHWCQWILLCPQYSSEKLYNKQCIHKYRTKCSCTNLMTIRDNYDCDSFLPWKLGSQSCEKAF